MDWYSGLTIEKDPDASLMWRWDWSDWLSTGDTIASAAVTSGSGITDNGGTVADDVYVDVLLSGGTAGERYTVAVKITTVAGYVDERTVIFKVVER